MLFQMWRSPLQINGQEVGKKHDESQKLQGKVYSHEESAPVFLSFSKNLAGNQEARERHSQFVISAVSFVQKYGSIEAFEQKFKEFLPHTEFTSLPGKLIAQRIPKALLEAYKEYSALAGQASQLSDDPEFKHAVKLKISSLINFMGSLSPDIEIKQILPAIISKRFGLTKEPLREAANAIMGLSLAGMASSDFEYAFQRRQDDGKSLPDVHGDARQPGRRGAARDAAHQFGGGRKIAARAHPRVCA